MNPHLQNAAVIPSGVLVFAFAMATAAQPTVRAVVQPIRERKPASEFRLLDATKSPVSLSRFRGKVVLVNFWATECGGCRTEIPYFAEFDGKYRSKGVEILGLSMDISYENLKGPEDAWARVNPFVQSHRLAFPILMADDAVGKAWHIESMPATYLIDRQGRIAASYIGIVDKSDVETNLSQLLAER